MDPRNLTLIVAGRDNGSSIDNYLENFIGVLWVSKDFTTFLRRPKLSISVTKPPSKVATEDSL